MSILYALQFIEKFIEELFKNPFKRSALMVQKGAVRAINEGSNLAKANLERASLQKINLKKADLSGTNLAFADLRDAILIDANLTGANLESANLSGADLRNANLDGANLESADLSKAKTEGAIFTNTILDRSKAPDLNSELEKLQEISNRITKASKKQVEKLKEELEEAVIEETEPEEASDISSFKIKEESETMRDLFLRINKNVEALSEKEQGIEDDLHKLHELEEELDIKRKEISGLKDVQLRTDKNDKGERYE